MECQKREEEDWKADMTKKRRRKTSKNKLGNGKNGKEDGIMTEKNRKKMMMTMKLKKWKKGRVSRKKKSEKKRMLKGGK
ncbi:unnamed protein product [Heligmosomoides polygyrus]|uniref:Uncharacterized protein n=1 Tax=Heligmosomoides polygyrus TaxID=6339 RepID=A0A183FRU5_HELPZ|nr:unnamed protein product [Heligmosomoides polygyrus]